jgi:predicted regulator of Ras-like GTPase activity (Roadblock/LC7/MglB family)
MIEMANIKSVLGELVTLEGVNAAVLVGRDGFVIDGVTNRSAMDVEGIGAVISAGVGSAESMGRELTVGRMQQGMYEFGDGVIVLSLLGDQAIMAVVADGKANVGNVRYQIKKRTPDLVRML